LDAVWAGVAVEEANLAVQISALRRVLDRQREQGSCIQTVAGRGYRFVGEVSRAEPTVSPSNRRAEGLGPTVVAAPPSNQPQQRHIDHGVLARGWRPRLQLWQAAALALIGLLSALSALNWPLLPMQANREAPRLSIVVLPFADLSEKRDQEYFAD